MADFRTTALSDGIRGLGFGVRLGNLLRNSSTLEMVDEFCAKGASAAPLEAKYGSPGREPWVTGPSPHFRHPSPERAGEGTGEWEGSGNPRLVPWAKSCHSSGAERVGRVLTQGAKRRQTMWLSPLVLVILAATGCRNDMHQQPKYLPLESSAFFSDGRAARPALAGTVAHGKLRTDELLYTGKINGVTADQFPFSITREDLERGRERYNIDCSPCHDYTGSGHGVVVQRGLLQPPSYHSDKLRKMPVGHFYEVITNGYGQMYSYASRVTPDDRWRIAAYIRALQLSQNATINDVPADQRQQLNQKGQ